MKGTAAAKGVFFFFAVAVVLSLGLFGSRMYFGSGGAMKPVEELKVRITSSTQIPEPTNIASAGDWYYLDHISGGLAFYDSARKTFSPLYAASWSEQANGTHVFKLREGIKFSDGTPITIKDVIWSIKRHLIFKTSTHFPLWEYLVGCDHLQRLDDECPGIRETPAGEIEFTLKAQTDSFFLQLASPETGIWAATDMDPATSKLTPTKFSGAYSVEKITDDYALLKRNEFSPISQKFPNSPRSIRSLRIPLAKCDDPYFKSKKVIKPHNHSTYRLNLGLSRAAERSRRAMS